MNFGPISKTYFAEKPIFADGFYSFKFGVASKIYFDTTHFILFCLLAN